MGSAKLKWGDADFMVTLLDALPENGTKILPLR